MDFKSVSRSFLLIVSISLSFSICSAEKGSNKKKGSDKEKTIKELVKDKTEFKGFLSLYQDKKNGSLMLEINDSQLNKPFIYFTHTVNGVLDAGHFKGAFREYKLLEFKKHFNKIEIISKTPRYLLDKENAISRSEGTNISPAILASLEIKAKDEKTGRYLVEADSVFLAETLHKVSPYPRMPKPGQPPRPQFKLGGLSKSKTKYIEIKNYPLNSDVVIEYVFDNKEPMVRGSLAVSDPRTTVVRMQHSFIQIPENDFKPRRDDPRVGYFHQQFDDLTSEDWVPYKDVINRWNLVKKDPSQAISEPVKPITWWIENTTPVEFRGLIKEAAERWNIAFEKAGFKNALVVKIQPDDADWDAGDIRYNVMRWTASPRPPFGGYGPSIANPLTGEIIAADIMLEYTFIKGRWLIEQIISDKGMLLEGSPKPLLCSAGHHLNQAIMFGQTALDITSAPEKTKSKLIEQTLSYLILHELGHTLGLNHNMKATQLFNATEVHDESKTQGLVAGSVMDYPALNVAPPGVSQGDFSTTKPGPYDLWVIEYGYSTALSDDAEEEKRLAKILDRSMEDGLEFGNDADDMRAPGLHIDPRVMIGDMSNEAIKYSRGRFELVNHLFGELKAKISVEGEGYQGLVFSTRYLLNEWSRAAEVVSRYIGGVEIERSNVGQDGEVIPYKPISKKTQKEAMTTLSEFLFAPNILENVKPLLGYLQPQRRGFNGFNTNEDPKLHVYALNSQRRVLDHLMHPNVLSRISESTLYGNEYSLSEYFNDLTSAIFDEDLDSNVNSIRRNLQIEFTKRMINISGLVSPTKYDYASQSNAIHQLKMIEKKIKYNKGTNETKIHRNMILQMLSKPLS